MSHNADAGITLTVDEVNAAPALSGVPASATIPELAAYTFTAAATHSDVPAQTLTFSLVGAPAGASINDSTGVYAWTPSEAQGPASYPFTVRVSDGVTDTDAGITLTVDEWNAAPVLSGVPTAATIRELAAYTFTAGDRLRCAGADADVLAGRRSGGRDARGFDGLVRLDAERAVLNFGENRRLSGAGLSRLEEKTRLLR